MANPFAGTVHQNLEVDEADNDSAFEDDDAQSTTTSLSESIYNYRLEHGRTYHAYNDGKYIFPNDDRERDRLDLQHHLFNLCFKDKLFFAPIQNPRHTLDIGTGTGIWAMDFADEYPDCQVVGTDLSPIQPNFVPPNLSFVIDDAEDHWLWEQKFDFIHFRLMGGSFKDWRTVMQSAYDCLAPGGYIEIQDYELPPKSLDGSVKETALERWGELLIEAAKVASRPIGCCESFKEWLENVGFVDIQQQVFVWPTNPWPKGDDEKTLGKWNLLNVTDGLEGFSLALLTRFLKWEKPEVDVLCAQVRADLRDRSIHGFFDIPVIYGRKPLQPSNPFG